ncbi:MAG: hypothetical protein GY715_07860 [Planctomycetes bacterium]|nr:hypothetical protein [Planctomycetota bacterium]
MQGHDERGNDDTRQRHLGPGQVAAALLLTCMVPASAALAVSQDEMTVTTLLASDGGSGDHFGNAIAMSEDVILIGAHEDNDLGADSGSAYIRRTAGGSWQHELKLNASDGAAGDQFGYSVAVEGPVAVIGARKDDDLGSSSGSVYVFRDTGSGWVEEAKLHAPDGASSDKFGTAVVINGNRIAVSATGDDDGGSSSGSIHLFVHDGSQWLHEQKLVVSDDAAGDFLGKSLCLDGNVLAAGAYGVDDMGSNAGAAYVFRRTSSGWQEEAKVLAFDGTSGALMGWSVCLSGDALVVGAPQHTGINGPSAGAAYLFRHGAGAWNLETKLLASNGAGFDKFGLSVGLTGNTAVIGANLNDEGYPDTGSAYMFQHDGTTWNEQTMVVSPSGYYWDQFGYAIAVTNGAFVVGAIEDDDMGNNAGSAFVFEYEAADPPAECLGDVDGNGDIDFTDVLAVLSAWGTCGGCPEDIDDSGFVDFTDVLAVLGTWGPCP